METLKVGIVGAGWMGHARSRLAENAPRRDCRHRRCLAPAWGISSPSTTARCSASPTWPACSRKPTLTRSISACRITSTPKPSSPPPRRQAILCEKPLCTTLEDAAVIREALAESGVCVHGGAQPALPAEPGRGTPSPRLGSAGEAVCLPLGRSGAEPRLAAGRHPTEIGGGKPLGLARRRQAHGAAR